MIAIVYFNTEYYNWAEIYLESLYRVEPDVKVVVYAYDMSKGRIRSLNAWKQYNVLEVIRKSLVWDEEKATAYRYQLVCGKGELLLETMKKYPEEELFMMSDIDLLFRKSLEFPKKIMSYYDIGFVMTQLRSNDPDNRLLKAMSGLIFTKNNDMTRMFWKEYHKRSMKGHLVKQKEQRVLAELFEKYYKKCNFYIVDYGYYLNAANWKYANVWSPHKSRFGDKRDRIDDFRKELKRLEAQDAKKEKEKLIKEYEATITARKKRTEMRATLARTRRKKMTIKEEEE